MRLADGRPADLYAIPLLVDAAAPCVMELGELGSTTLELTIHLRRHPCAGLVGLSSLYPPHHQRHDEDFEIWGSEGHLVAQSRQLAILPPVAGDSQRLS